MSSDIKFKIILFIAFIVIWILASECTSYESSIEWNNGICSKCGGQWSYQQIITRGRYNERTHYIYKCNKCGRMIELDNYYQ